MAYNTWTAEHWPPGMPNPANPWPWMDEYERARVSELPYWQERFTRYPEIYKQWILKRNQ